MDMIVVQVLCGTLGAIGAILFFVLAWEFRKRKNCLTIFIISGIICAAICVVGIAMSDGVTWSDSSSDDDFAYGMSEDEFNDFADWNVEQDRADD